MPCSTPNPIFVDDDTIWHMNDVLLLLMNERPNLLVFNDHYYQRQTLMTTKPSVVLNNNRSIIQRLVKVHIIQSLDITSLMPCIV